MKSNLSDLNNFESISENKKSVRVSLQAKLKALSAEQKVTASKLIQDNLKNELQNADGYWAAFNNLSDEPQIKWPDVSSKVNWVFPETSTKSLKFKSQFSKAAKSAIGVHEPIDGVDVPLKDILGFIIPCLGADKNGVRLGRGKGFYDQALSGLSAKKIGVCFESSFCEELPQEKHDIKLNKIITEKRIFSVELQSKDNK